MRYLYALYALLTFLVFFLLILPFIYFFGLFGKRGRTWVWYLLKGWGYAWYFVLGIKVERYFEAKPRKVQNYIVIANHSSFLDPTMIFRCLPFFTLTLATKAFSKIPFFGFLYRRMTVLVDRESASSRQKSIKKLQELLHKGESIFIFPEGGILKSEKMLNPFYDGAFRLSVETGIPILPILFPDTSKRWGTKGFWDWHTGKCRAVFLKEIFPENFKATDLKSYTFSEMESALKTYREK